AGGQEHLGLLVRRRLAEGRRIGEAEREREAEQERGGAGGRRGGHQADSHLRTRGKREGGGSEGRSQRRQRSEEPAVPAFLWRLSSVLCPLVNGPPAGALPGGGGVRPCRPCRSARVRRGQQEGPARGAGLRIGQRWV